MAIGATTAEVGKSDPIITRLVSEDPVPWWKKPNLRFLYFMLFPTCMGVELTSGFDSQMINALQIVPSWENCTLFLLSANFEEPMAKRHFELCGDFSANYDPTITDFENPQGSLKGIIAAAYSLGAILSLPFIPIVNERFGRRWSIFGGSLVMVVGALIQGFSQHGKYNPDATTLVHCSLLFKYTFWKFGTNS